jgi:RNA polymerase sigma factor (sigma-70 family)
MSTTSSLNDYCTAIRQYDLLTKEDEHRLCQAVQSGLAADRELDAGHPDPDGDLRDASLAGAEAASTFVHANLRLVVSIARRSMTVGKSDDAVLAAVQEGNCGLMRAVTRFDSSKGFKFSTFATWHIRAAMERGVSQSRFALSVSHTGVERISALRRAELDFPGASDAFFADRLGLSVVEIRHIRDASLPLRPAYTESDDGPLGAFDSLRSEVADREFAVAAAASSVAEALSCLSDFETAVITACWGLGGEVELSTAECAEALNVDVKEVKTAKRLAKSKLAAWFGVSTDGLDR